MAGCKSGTTNEETTDTAAVSTTTAADTIPQYRETEDIHLDGKETEYVLIFRSAGCAESMLREIGDDSVQLDDFYTAEDDLGYYYYMCYQRLEAMGVKYYETSADKKVYCQDGIVFAPQDSCACGVLIVKPGCRRFEFIDLMDFLYPNN